MDVWECIEVAENEERSNGMENPNEYNEERFRQFDMEASDAVYGLWEAGASLEDIESVVQNGLENVIEGVRVACSITMSESTQ